MHISLNSVKIHFSDILSVMFTSLVSHTAFKYTYKELVSRHCGYSFGCLTTTKIASVYGAM